MKHEELTDNVVDEYGGEIDFVRYPAFDLARQEVPACYAVQSASLCSSGMNRFALGLFGYLVCITVLLFLLWYE